MTFDELNGIIICVDLKRHMWQILLFTYTIIIGGVKMKRTKIVCTIGPATMDKEILKKMMLAGMNVGRFNFSHGSYEDQEKFYTPFLEARKEVGLPVAALLDTQGPEIRTGMLYTGKNKKIAMEKAESLLQEIGLYGRKNHLPSELSGGERQRVAVARSLINDPKIILADEPTGNLDPENAALISDLLYGVSEKYSKTLVIVTHDKEVAKKAQIIYRLQDKQIVQENKE